MSELVVISKTDLEEVLTNTLTRIIKGDKISFDETPDKLNQKQAAAFLGITQSTLIRWKKNGLVPCEQLPRSTKVTYYKSQLKSVLQKNPSLLQAARK